MTKALMTLTELADAAAALVSGVDQHSGRVREQPDVRTVRYYTTLGLIDRAAEMRGRTAYYSERHLRQLVAIKRMQAEGLTLGEIQERLLGISAQGLRALAPLPDRPPELEPEPKKARTGFWRDRPSPPNAPLPQQPRAMTTVALGEGVLLTIDGAPLSPEQYQAILDAAQPLLRVLETTKRSEP